MTPGMWLAVTSMYTSFWPTKPKKRPDPLHAFKEANRLAAANQLKAFDDLEYASVTLQEAVKEAIRQNNKEES